MRKHAKYNKTQERFVDSVCMLLNSYMPAPSAQYVRGKLYKFYNKRVRIPLKMLRSVEYLACYAKEQGLENITSIEGIYVTTFKQPKNNFSKEFHWTFCLRGVILVSENGNFVPFLDSKTNWTVTLEQGRIR